MKAIIEGRRYNTETAYEIASYSNNLGRGDFNNYSETLYKTKKGVYFLAGEGGAASKYSWSCGNGSIGGDGIIVLSVQEAFDWAEQHMDIDAMEIWFGDMIADA